MGIDDRDYMRTSKKVRRASDQRSPGDPRRANDVFLPGTTHARPTNTRRIVVLATCAAIALMVVMFLILG